MLLFRVEFRYNTVVCHDAKSTVTKSQFYVCVEEEM
jgi:hypothetical protein